MVYTILEAISSAIYSVVSCILYVEENLIDFMIFCLLTALKIVCHPIMILPLLFGIGYAIATLMPKRSEEMTLPKYRMIMAARNNGGYNFGHMSRFKTDYRSAGDCVEVDEQPH